VAVKTRRQYAGGAAATTIGGALASAGVTTFSIASATGWPASTTVPFYVVVSPQTSSEEKMLVTLNGQTVTVVTRGADGTTANTHASGAAIYPVVTAVDLDEANELTSSYAHTGAIVYQGVTTFNELTVGSTDHVLKVAAGVPTWGQVDTAGIADSAVTSAKIAANTVAAGDIADAFKKLVCPVGTITAFGGTTAPTGWLLCDGSAIAGGYTELIALVGVNTPDLKGRFPIGDNASLTLLGQGGSATITTNQIPSHSHANTASASTSVSLSDPGHGHTVNQSNAGGHDHTWSTGGGSHQHSLYVDQLDSTVAHGHGTDGTLMSGTSATPEGNTRAYTETSNAGYEGNHSHSGTTSAVGDHGHSVSVNGNTTGISVSSASTTVTMTNAQAGGGQDYYPPYVVVNFIIKHDY
jgi:microcystin-dependent protein